MPRGVMTTGVAVFHLDDEREAVGFTGNREDLANLLHGTRLECQVREAFAAEAIERRIHVDRVPQDNEIDDETKRPELVFLAFPIALPQFTALAVEDDPRELVATLAAIELDQDAAAVTLVIDKA